MNAQSWSWEDFTEGPSHSPMDKEPLLPLDPGDEPLVIEQSIFDLKLDYQDVTDDELLPDRLLPPEDDPPGLEEDDEDEMLRCDVK